MARAAARRPRPPPRPARRCRCGSRGPGLALTKARKPWAADEVRQLAGHPVQRTDDGGYCCTICGWVWKRKPQNRTECPGLPRYVKGTVPEHLKTERQLRKDDRVEPTGPAVAVLYLPYQSGVGFIPLYRTESAAAWLWLRVC